MSVSLVCVFVCVCVNWGPNCLSISCVCFVYVRSESPVCVLCLFCALSAHMHVSFMCVFCVCAH